VEVLSQPPLPEDAALFGDRRLLSYLGVVVSADGRVLARGTPIRRWGSEPIHGHLGCASDVYEVLAGPDQGALLLLWNCGVYDLDEAFPELLLARPDDPILADPPRSASLLANLRRIRDEILAGAGLIGAA